jgi:localization factor PodJL
MKSNIPWSVKGIDPEAREAAKIAARRAGMTLGEWLNSLILQSGELPEGLAAQLAAEAARESAREDAARSGRSDFEDNEETEDPTELQTRLETFNRRLDASERQSALAVSGIDQSIERLASTIESSRRLLASGEVAPKSTVNELASRIEQLQSQLEHVAVQGRSGLDSRTLMALEKAIAGVASHIEKSDRRNAELVHSVEGAISELSAKVGHAEAASSEAISRIDLSLDRVSGRIDTTEAEQRRSSARLNERLAQLDERLATTHVQREAGIGAVERRLAGLETRLETVQGQIKAQIDEVRARPVMPPEAVSRTEFEDWSRRQAADQGSSQATARQSLANLEARIAVLTERADRLQREGGTQSSAAVERAAETARSAGERADVAAKQLGALSDELSSDVAEIGQRLDRANHTATETMQALEGVLRSLSRRLETLEGRPPRPAVPEAVDEPVQDETPPARAAASERKPAGKSPGWLWRDEPAEPARSAKPPQPEESERAVEDSQATEEFVEIYEATSVTEFVSQPRDDANDDELKRDERGDGRPQEGGSFDLSNLAFSLDGARDRQPDEEEAHTGPGFEGAESSEQRAEDNSWLEQARRAAKAAGPADRSSDYGEAKEPRSRAIYWLAAIILVVLAAGFLAYRGFTTNRKAPESRPTAVQSTVPGQRTPGLPSGKAAAPNQKPPAIENRNEPLVPAKPQTVPAPATPSASPEDILAPREGDLGPQLPSDAKTSSDIVAQPAPAAAARDSVPAPGAKLGAADARKAAAESGDPKAQYGYAVALKAKGDKAQAVEFMRKAAGQGLAIAQGKLGEWYEHGEGLQIDETEAAKWYQRAAEGGYVQAMHNLGFFSAQGMGGLKRDGPTAERWFKKAAQQGLLASQVNLAIVLFDTSAFPPAPGADLEKRTQDAYFWAALAAARGDQGAGDLRNSIAARLGPEVRATLDKKVSSWKVQPLDANANGGFDTSGQAYLPADQQTALGRDEIIEVQELLNALDFKNGTPDGKLSPQVENAIKSFQTAYHLPPSGVADHNLLAALRAASH